MRKMKNVVLMFLVVYMIFAHSIMSYAAEEGEQKYFLLYMYGQDAGAAVEIGTYQIIMDQESDDINLDNLTLFPIETGVYHPFQMEQLDGGELTREIREYLLYAGYAQIDDEKLAEDYELAARDHARTYRLGGWAEITDEYENAAKHKRINYRPKRKMPAKEHDVNFIQRLLREIVQMPPFISFFLMFILGILSGCSLFVFLIWMRVKQKRKRIQESTERIMRESTLKIR